MNKIIYSYIVLSFLVGIITTVLVFTIIKNKNVPVATVIETTVVPTTTDKKISNNIEKPFSFDGKVVTNHPDSEYSSARYSFSGRKNVDLSYYHFHQPNEAEYSYVCFSSVLGGQLSYTGKATHKVGELNVPIDLNSYAYCILQTNDLLKSLHKNPPKTEKDINGHSVEQDYFEGTLNATVIGFDIDESNEPIQAETHNRIIIEKINEVYR